MNAIAVPFRQLVERRLWPLAALLVAALVAVPVMLSKDPAPVASAPTAVASAQGETQPIVSIGDPAQTENVRKVLGSRKNPFRPAIAAKEAKPVSDATVAQAPSGDAKTDAPATGGAAPATGGGGEAVSGPPAPTVAPAPTTPEKTYELYSLKVRFGDSAADTLPARTVKRLKALPSSEDAALIYLGLLKDRKTAVFLVDGAAKVQGDGRCLPSTADCQTLQMKRGDTAFIDMPSADGGSDRQFQLDLVKIRTSETTDAKAAARSYAAEARGGRAALRARVSRARGLRFDQRRGVLVAPATD
jgi:hypothetical protein